MKYFYKKVEKPGDVLNHEWRKCDAITFSFYAGSPEYVTKVDEGFNYSDMVKALAKDGGEILKTLTPEKCHINHMALGVAGEAGELVDVIKKHINYNTELNMDLLIKEMGDLEFYLEGLRQAFGISRGDVLIANSEKLSERYKDFVYSDERAVNRVDVKLEK